MTESSIRGRRPVPDLSPDPWAPPPPRFSPEGIAVEWYANREVTILLRELALCPENNDLTWLALADATEEAGMPEFAATIRRMPGVPACPKFYFPSPGDLLWVRGDDGPHEPVDLCRWVWYDASAMGDFGWKDHPKSNLPHPIWLALKGGSETDGSHRTYLSIGRAIAAMCVAWALAVHRDGADLPEEWRCPV